MSESDLRKGLTAMREELRLLMIRQETTEERETYSDGFFNGLAHSISRIDAVVSANPCPTCSWPNRETVGMVCQTCGVDYGVSGKDDTDDQVNAIADVITPVLRNIEVDAVIGLSLKDTRPAAERIARVLIDRFGVITQKRRNL